MSEEQSTEAQQREAVAQLCRAAQLAVDIFAVDHIRDLDSLPRALSTGLIVEATIAYLVGEGLIEVVAEWPELFNMQIRPHLMPSVDTAVAAHARVRRPLR